jgi:hypothetical protein
MQQLQKIELSREIIEQIKELQQRIGYISVQAKKNSDYSMRYNESVIEELEKQQLEISGFESIEKMHKAIGRFYKGGLDLGFLSSMNPKEFLYNNLISRIDEFGNGGGDWLEQMYYMRLLVELLENRPYGQGLFSHVPEEKDEKKSDESKEIEVGEYHVWNGVQKDVNYQINIYSGLYLFEIMEILEKNGFVVYMVDPISYKSASYFSEDFQSIREVHRKNYLGLRVNVRKYSRFHKDSKIVLHI